MWFTSGIAQHIHKVIGVESPDQETTPTTIELLPVIKITQNSTLFSDMGTQDTNVNWWTGDETLCPAPHFTLLLRGNLLKHCRRQRFWSLERVAQRTVPGDVGQRTDSAPNTEQYRVERVLGHTVIPLNHA